MAFAEEIYRFAAKLPDSERFGLTSQLRRAAVSIPSNIAEGAGLGTSKGFLRHLRIARGSVLEIETQLTLAVRLKLTPRDQAIDVWSLQQEVARLLNGLIASLKKEPPND